MHGQNGDSYIKNRVVNTAGEGETGTNGESSIDIYTLLCVKQTVIAKLLNNTGGPVWHSVMGWGEGREAQDSSRGGYMYNYG